MNTRVVSAALAIGLLAPALPAQTREHDWVVSNLTGYFGSSVLNFDIASRLVTLNLPLPAAGCNAVVLDPETNFDYVVAAGDGLFRVRNDGTVQTIVSGLGSSIDGLDVSQEGYFLVGRNGGILNLVTPAGAVSTIATGLGWQSSSYNAVNAVKVDLDTGHTVVGLFNAGGAFPSLWRVTPAGSATTLVGPGLGPITGIDQDPATGDFFVTTFGSLLRVTGGGSVTTVATGTPELAGAQAIQVLPTGHPEGEGNLAVASGGSSGETGLYVLDPRTGRVLSTILRFPLGSAHGIFPSGLAVNRSRTLSGDGWALRRTNYHLRLRGPFARRDYALCAALSPRPGIALPDGRVVHLAFDSLFYLTVTNTLPAVFQGFRGIFDSSGRAEAYVLLLDDPVLVGLRTWYSFVVVDPAAPNGVAHVSNPFGFTILR